MDAPARCGRALGTQGGTQGHAGLILRSAVEASKQAKRRRRSLSGAFPALATNSRPRRWPLEVSDGQRSQHTASCLEGLAPSGNSWTSTLPAHFPPGKVLRVTVDGGTLSLGGTSLAWDSHGYYEVALDAGILTWSP